MEGASSNLTNLKATRIDVVALRVLAHPLRSRLLSQLRLRGPATATSLAKTLDTNTGATSYHLRRLAEVGLVEEAEQGVGRERWWRAAHDMHTWSSADFLGDPDSEAAMEWLQREYFRMFTEHVQQWAAEEATWSPQWRDAAGASDYVLRLTAPELKGMQHEIFAVVERYRLAGEAAEAEATSAEAADETDRQRVRVYLHCFPDPRGTVR